MSECPKGEQDSLFGHFLFAGKQRKKLNKEALANLLLMFNSKLSKKLYNGNQEIWARAILHNFSAEIITNIE